MKAKPLAIVGLFLLAGAVQAQGFQDEPTCYSWNGGHKSAGSFSKCNPDWKVATVKPPAAVVPAPVVQAAPPVQILQSCPPIAEPKRKPIIRKKPRPKPVC